MKSKVFVFFLLVFGVQNSLLGQNTSIDDLFIQNIDSLISEQLQYQRSRKSVETLVSLKDSARFFYYGDIAYPCENQPIVYYYTYDEFANLTLFETKNTPEPNCEQSKRQVLITYPTDDLVERTSQQFDFNLNDWVNTSRLTLRYDINDYLIEQVKEIWNNQLATWNNELLYTRIYDGDLLLEYKRSSWDSIANDWFLIVNETLVYNSYNSLVEDLYWNWDFTNNEWELTRKQTNSYDAGNNLIETVQYRKYSSENVYDWSTINKNEFDYDANNFLVQEYSYIDWNNINMDWDTKRKYDYLNNTSGFPEETQLQVWDEANSNWKNEALSNYVYNTNNDIVAETTKLWEVSSWINSRKETIMYNSDFFLTESLEQVWDTNTSAWLNNYLTSKTYNTFNKVTASAYEYWSGSAGWYVFDQYIYEYDQYQHLIYVQGISEFDFTENFYYYSEHEVTLGNDDNLFNSQLVIYPNPTGDFITIQGVVGKVRISIYNLTGKTVLVSEIGNNIDVSNLQEGVYFISVLSGTTAAYSRFIKK